MTEKSHISPWLTSLLRPLHTSFMPTYFQLTIHGQEHIPQIGPIILAPVHRSRWDALMIHLLTPRLPHFMTSKNEFVGAQRWFMENLGAFAINAERPNASAVRYCQELMRDQEAIVVFPEGGLHYFEPNQVYPLKPGVAWLALNCQRELPDQPVEIIPIRFIYGDKILRFRSKVTIQILPPLVVKDYLALPAKTAIAQLTADLQKALGDTVNEDQTPAVVA